MKLQLRREADDEIDAIFAYYASQRPGLEKEFFDAVYDELSAIARNSARCGWIDDRFRKCRLSRFPYVIIYEPKSVVEVIAVCHQSRDPNYWRSRVS